MRVAGEGVAQFRDDKYEVRYSNSIDCVFVSFASSRAVSAFLFYTQMYAQVSSTGASGRVIDFRDRFIYWFVLVLAIGWRILLFCFKLLAQSVHFPLASKKLEWSFLEGGFEVLLGRVWVRRWR